MQMNQTAANILVVDDDQRLRDLLDRYLGEQGFGVHAVANAPAMDKVMGKEDVDMIILDLMLPGEDGMSVCRRLRAAGRRIPIIIDSCVSADRTHRRNPIIQPHFRQRRIASGSQHHAASKELRVLTHLPSIIQHDDGRRTVVKSIPIKVANGTGCRK